MVGLIDECPQNVHNQAWMNALNDQKDCGGEVLRANSASRTDLNIDEPVWLAVVKSRSLIGIADVSVSQYPF
jgi:hypothetical protein